MELQRPAKRHEEQVMAMKHVTKNEVLDDSGLSKRGIIESYWISL